MSSPTSLEQLFDACFKKHLLVIGDIILDTYWQGEVYRISPEAPIPIVNFKNEYHRLGGASNVALNLVKLGASVALFGVVGHDRQAQILTQLLESNHIHTQGLFKDETRKTTEKLRVTNTSSTQLLRIDREQKQAITNETEQSIINLIFTSIEKERPDAIILQDYNKGVLTPRLIDKIITYANKQGIPTSVDPKENHFFEYKNATIFKPNLKEVKSIFEKEHITVNSNNLNKVFAILSQRLNINHLVVTLADKGVYHMSKNGYHNIIPAHLRQIADVSGAGDTAIAIMTLLFTCTNDITRSVQIANVAAGLVCEKKGTSAVEQSELLEECKRLLTS